MSISMVDMSEIDLFIPERRTLANSLQAGLRENFAEATVEWVDCPDLTQAPFNLAAPGLCGDAVLLEMGGMSQLFPRPQVMCQYYFKDVLKEIYNNHNNVFVIGAGIGLHSNQQLGEFLVNTSFSYSQETANFMELKNQSRLLCWDPTTGGVMNSIANNSNLTCYPFGNFFISEGKPGKVLKVYVKNCIGVHFLTAMQHVLSKYSFKINPKLVGLGGTFVMKKGRARHHLMPYWNNHQLKTAKNIHNWLRYFDIDAPLMAVGTFISNSSFYEQCCQRAGRNGYGLTESHFHAISSNGVGGHFYTELEPIDAVEYLGYFHPAKVFHHMDPQFRFDGLQDFNDIMTCWPDTA
ncbi:ester hydrolase C11orf54 homolog [Anoplolepis gracilipes]|uniref:ester hydrolase C11orf54 homolog n=1 Tax=Anoplolepis gracilipes TaxID=354296 RepID=UPI003BA3DFD1